MIKTKKHFSFFIAILFLFAYGLINQPADADTVADTSAPTAPQQLIAYQGTATSVELRWIPSIDQNDPTVAYTIYNNGSSFGSSSTNDFVAKGLTPSTAYVFTVTATDPAGNVSPVSNTLNFTTTRDITPPTALITYPTNGQVLSGLQTFTATSTDDAGVSYVQYFLDGNMIGSQISSNPFNLDFNADNYPTGSQHNLVVKAFDAAGNAGTSPTVNFSVGKSTAASPYNIQVNNITYNSASISWQTNSGVIGSIQYGTSSSYGQTTSESLATTQHNINLTNLQGGQTYHFAAFSKLSSLATSSSTDATFLTLSASIQPSATNLDTTSPITILLTPAAGSTVSGSVTLSASVTDPIVTNQVTSGVSSVKFFVDGGLNGNEIYSAPFTSVWNSTAGSNGKHTIDVVARDNAGNYATSTTIVYSTNTAPTVPQSPDAHKNGTLILNGSTVYLITNGQKAAFRDSQEYQSYGYKFTQAVPASSGDLQLSTADQILKAMPGTLVLDKADKKTVYMVGTAGSKRGFASGQVFTGLGYDFKDLSQIDMTDYTSGSAITSATDAHPDGALVLDGQTVWWILGGKKQGFESAAVFNTYGFSFSKIVKANSADLALPTGPLVKFRDGTLVLNGGNYYLISDGKKLKFTSSDKLAGLGYKLENVISSDLSSYDSGDDIQ